MNTVYLITSYGNKPHYATLDKKKVQELLKKANIELGMSGSMQTAGVTELKLS